MEKSIFVSWVILAVITFGVLQAFNTATISTEIISGLLAKMRVEAVQTLDAIKDQLTTLFFPW